MIRVQKIYSQILKDESAQGATEYILLLVVIVGLAMIFKGQITSMVTDKLSKLSSSVNDFTSQ